MRLLAVISFLLGTNNAYVSSFIVISKTNYGRGGQKNFCDSNACTTGTCAPKQLKSTIDDNPNEAQISPTAASQSKLQSSFTDPSLSSSSSSSSSSSPETHEQQRQQQQQQFELWLDLRQTTISPQAALLHLTNDLWDEYIAPENKSFLIDKVLVSAKANDNRDDEQDKINMKKIIDDVMEEYEDEIQVLFEDNNGVIKSLVMTNSHDSEGSSAGDDVNDNGNFYVQSQNEGHKYQIYDDETGLINIYTNPMPALETISSGDWLVLDSRLEDEEKRKEAIQSLVELCSGGLNFNLDLSGSETDNEKTGKDCDDGNPALISGGIAIDCSSNAEIFEAGALIKSLSGNEKGYKATKSGILVQSDQANDSGVLPPRRQKSGSMKYAILIPFDALLWKTASFVIASHGEEDGSIMYSAK